MVTSRDHATLRAGTNQGAVGGDVGSLFLSTHLPEKSQRILDPCTPRAGTDQGVLGGDVGYLFLGTHFREDFQRILDPAACAHALIKEL